jgi:hypothetical protein
MPANNREEEMSSVSSLLPRSPRGNSGEISRTSRADLNSFADSVSGEEADYLADVTMLVMEALELANWPPLDTKKQLPTRAAIWTYRLIGRVPREDLSDAFERAVEDHRGSYPVNAYEVRQAHKEILRERRHKARVAPAPESKPCDLTHVAGENRMVMLGAFGREELMPCPNCRPAAFAQREKAIRSRAQQEALRQVAEAQAAITAERARKEAEETMRWIGHIESTNVSEWECKVCGTEFVGGARPICTVCRPPAEGEDQPS